MLQEGEEKPPARADGSLSLLTTITGLISDIFTVFRKIPLFYHL